MLSRFKRTEVNLKKVVLQVQLWWSEKLGRKKGFSAIHIQKEAIQDHHDRKVLGESR